ncbi:MAG: YceD family protein [Gammaproteobacteria bacterium]
MAPDQPLYIAPVKLAVSAKRIAGGVAIAEMPRLSELVLNQGGDVGYELEFSKDAQGFVRIGGNVSVSLNVICQRCLNPMVLELSNPVTIGFTTDQEKVTQMPDMLEPYISEEQEIPLAGLLEEEVILGLPLSPLHSPEDCPAQEIIEEYAVKKENPFAVLKDIRSKK